MARRPSGAGRSGRDRRATARRRGESPSPAAFGASARRRRASAHSAATAPRSTLTGFSASAAFGSRRAASRRPMSTGGRPPVPRSGSRACSSAARSAASALAPCPAAVSSMWPRRGCSGRRASARPCAVTAPEASSAPSAASSARASASAGAGGGVRKARPAPVGSPQSASSSARPVRSALAISGGAWAAIAPSSPRVQSRKHQPGATRPARPRRCSASARVTRSVTRRAMPEAGSKRDRRARPPSTTTRTSGIVSEVSAIEVASTSLRRPSGAGASAARWSASGRPPCSGCSSASGGRSRASAAATRPISAWPGRKTRTPPAVAASAARTRSATAASKRGPPGPGDQGRSSQIVSTGCARPSAVTSGAPPISAATGAASSVADIAISARSGRSAERASSASARPRSACRPRSWNSSKITQPTPGRSGADCSIRVSTPSVTTSIRAPGTLSPRMR